MAAILIFFVLKESFKNDSSTSAQILLWGAIHAQLKEKQTFISKNKATPMITEATPMTTLILQTKILKKHTLHPSILGVRDRETYFAPEYTRGPRLKG